jgi:hypothetical protein
MIPPVYQFARCPRCGEPAYCDRCAFCPRCKFAAPEVDLPQPPPPAPKTNGCDECHETTTHARTCSVTVLAAGN